MALNLAVTTMFITQTPGIPLDDAARVEFNLQAVPESIGTAAVPGAGIAMLVIIL